MPIKVDVITPEKLVFSDRVDFIAAPAVDGEIGILPHHTPLLTRLGVGELRFKKGGAVSNRMAIAGGFLEVSEDNSVNIFAETAELSSEIDLERARLAAQVAKEKLTSSKDLTAEELAQVEASLTRALTRLKVGNMKRSLRFGGQPTSTRS